MNLENFIAQRILKSREHKSSISSPIIKIAISAIAIGMIMMIVSVSTGIGLQEKIRNKLAAFSGHIVISNFDDNQSKVSTKPISTVQNFYPKFKNIPEVIHVQAVASKAGIIRTETTFEGIIFKGVGKDYNFQNIKEYLVQGKLPNFNENLNPEILISKYLSDRLNLKVGSSFNTFFMKEGQNKLPNLRRFKIVGIYNSGFQEFDATYIIGDIRHIQKMNRWQPNQVGSFEVFVNDFNQISSIGKQVYKQTNSTLDSKTIIQKYPLIFEWLLQFDFNIITILIIMIVVATINMVVALLVLILERTQMIGILKALGANNWSIRKIFLYNASYLILRGMLIGNIIAITILLVQKTTGIISLPPENYFVNAVPVNLDLGYLLLLNLGTILVCLLVLTIPSYVITKITPIQAIRFQ